MASYGKIGQKYYTVGSGSNLQEISEQDIIGLRGDLSANDYKRFGGTPGDPLSLIRSEGGLIDIDPSGVQLEYFAPNAGDSSIGSGGAYGTNINLGGSRAYLKNQAEAQALGIPLTSASKVPTGGQVQQSSEFANYLKETGQTYNPQVGFSGNAQIPSTQTNQQGAYADPNASGATFTPPQATNLNNEAYKDMQGNVFRANGTPINQGEFQKLGLNISHINTKQPTSKYEQGFNQYNAETGGKGEGSASIVNQYAPGGRNDLASSFVQTDEFMGGLFKSFQDFINPINQRKSLTETYNQMLKDSGVEAIDMELINSKRIIEGTIDDIRQEIQSAGGMGTESQINALASSRNKQLIRNYNTLLETRNAKEKYLETAMGLEQADRQSADQRFESAFGMGLQIANYGRLMKQDAIEAFDRTRSAIGWGGILQGTFGDPYAISLIEKAYGLPSGGLLSATQQESQAMAQAQQQAQLDLQMQQSQLKTEGLRQQQIQKDLRTPVGGGIGGGILSTLPTSVQTKLMSMAESFGSTDIVKKYNATVDGINLINGIDLNTQNPSDHQTIVYAFAKSLDPESVVREGEYETIKKYAQSSLNKYNKEITNALNGTGFLSREAIQNIKTTMNNNFASRKPAYENLRKEKARVIDSVAGRPVSDELLIDYSGGVTSSVSPIDNYVDTYVSGLTPAKESTGNWFSGLWNWLTK